MAREVKRLNVNVPLPVYQWLLARSEESGVPMAALMLSCVDKVRREEEVMGMMASPQLAALLEAMKRQEG